MSTQLIQSFSRKWASSTTIQDWSSAQYQAGWEVIGATPPEVSQFDALHNIQDRKIEWLFNLIKEYADDKNIILQDSTTSILKDALNNAGISTIYDPNRKYHSGEIRFFADDDNIPSVGNWYECYHPNGCKGIDPRDATNRADGWADTDISKPYYWLKHGKWIEQSPIGAPISYQKTVLSSLYIRYNNNAQLHKDKYWRLAEVYPNLISGNFITIADLRAVVIRGLDDGRGIDVGRVIGSEQLSQNKKHKHNITGWTGGSNVLAEKTDNVDVSFALTVGDGGIMRTRTPGIGTVDNTRRINAIGFDGGGEEARVRSVAALFATRI